MGFNVTDEYAVLHYNSLLSIHLTIVNDAVTLGRLTLTGRQSILALDRLIYKAINI